MAVLFYMDDGTKVWRLGNIEEVAVATSTVDERRALAGPQLGSEGASRAALEAPHVAVPLAQKPKAKASPSLGHSQETASTNSYLLGLDKVYKPSGVYIDDPKGLFILNSAGTRRSTRTAGARGLPKPRVLRIPAQARQRRGALSLDGQRANHQQGLPPAQGPAAHVHLEQEGREDGECRRQEEVMYEVCLV